MERIKTIFFGTPEFAATALKTLAANSRFDIVAVVTQPDKATGRKKIITPPPVKTVALEFGIPVLQPERLKDQAVDDIIATGAELAVVVAYGNLIPKRLLEALPRGFLNIHPSLLPKHRGASPITATILEGDKETGVCLMVLDEGMDHGPIIACRRAQLDNSETTESLRKKLTPIASEMLDKELIEYLDGKIVPVGQNHEEASFCKLIESDSAKIDWQKSVYEVDRLIRAMHGVTPAWTTLDEKMFLIHKSSLRAHSAGSGRSNPMPTVGTIINLDKKITVACADGYLILDEVQLAGGKPMSGQAFLNGHKDVVGKILM
jgi:methionyl-tRNA formyltransferase